MEYMESKMQDHIEAMNHQWSEYMTWLDQLEAIMRAWDAKHGNLPYVLPLVESTGLECWRDSFNDGMTPQEALDSDQSYWEE